MIICFITYSYTVVHIWIWKKAAPLHVNLKFEEISLDKKQKRHLKDGA